VAVVEETLSKLRGAGRFLVDDGGQRFESRVDAPASQREIDDAFERLPRRDELRELWSTARRAELFTDPAIGGWGLRLLSPAEAVDATRKWALRRPDDMLPATGGVLILLPRDARDAWYRLSMSLSEFLARYVDARGDKFWEVGVRR